MPTPRIFLIDANALCYRSFFAIKGLTTSYGQATNAIYGFVNTLRKILKDENPQYMAVCFDVGKKTRRQQKFAEYKIHRPSMPDDLVSQLPLIKKCILAFNIPIYEKEGFEADDVIATIAEKVKDQDMEAVIVSGDKDMLQLVNARVKLFNMKKGELINEEEARKIFGFPVRYITDYIALAGDKTDNIPGVTGIGKVTARQLINEFGALEEIYRNLDHIKSASVSQKLREQKERAFFCKDLAILDREVPLNLQFESLKVGKADSDYLHEFFRKLEFRKLAEEYSKNTAQSKNIAVTGIKNRKEAEDVFLSAKKKGQITVYFEDSSEGEPQLFSRMILSVNERALYQFNGVDIDLAGPIMESSHIDKCFYDIKKAYRIFSVRGIFLNGKVFDVLLAGYLLSPAAGSYDLNTLCWEYLKKAVGKNLSGEHRALLISSLKPVLTNELKDRQLWDLFENIEMPLARVLSDMETEGVTLDVPMLKDLSKECAAKIDDLAKKLYKLAGGEFNINSPKQLAHVLFEKLKLPVIRKTKTGFSTDESVLLKLALKHELPEMILEYRQLTKLKSTYIDALPKLVNEKTKRIHATFNQTGTETGRLSSNNPNLQNIPIRTELGRKIRKAFIPSKKSNVIISADYSQIELRILAHLSGDENLNKAFKKEQDIHRYTASLIFGVPEEKVTFDMRYAAKRVNFGIIYGMSSFGLAKDLKIKQSQAEEFISRYFARYPKVKQFMDSQIKMAQERGYVLTLLNRRRYLPEIKSENMAVAQFAQRQAINAPVQGTAADLIKIAMINLSRTMARESLQSQMIITVHDELVFDISKKEEKRMADLIRQEMESPLNLSVPIKTSVKSGKNWMELKEI